MTKRVLIVVLSAACVLAAASPAAVVRPTMRVVDTKPFIVRGSHFQPQEHVAVTVTAKAGGTKKTEASAAGTFLVRFRGVDVGYCASYTVTAVGSKGSRVGMKVRVPECPPPPPDPG